MVINILILSVIFFGFACYFKNILTMKKIFILSMALIALFAFCKKSSSTPSASLTATFNGTNKNFSVSAAGIKAVQSGVTGYAALGAVSLTTGEELDINIDNSLSGNPIVPGTYSDTSSNFVVDLQYNVSTTGDSYEGGTEIDGSQSGATGVSNHLKLVITSITSTTISGTFSGNMYLN